MKLFVFLRDNIQAVILTIIVIAALALLTFIYLKLRQSAIGKLEYSRSFSETGVYRGENVVLTETLYNPTPLPIIAVSVESYLYNGIRLKETEFDPKKSMQFFSSRFTIMPYQQIKRPHEAFCAERGYYRLETASVYCNKKTTYLDAPAELYIYPAIVPLENRAVPVNTEQGDTVTSRNLISDPFSFSGIRRYTSGDSFRSINFKATARSGLADISAFRVNNREFCSNRIFMVYLNFQLPSGRTIPSDQYNRMMELGLSYASDLIREAAYLGHRAGFVSNPVTVDGEESLRFQPESGEAHLCDILRHTSKVRNRPGASFTGLVEQDMARGISQTEIYLIVPIIDDDTEELAARLRRNENSVCIISLLDEEASVLKAEKAEKKVQDSGSKGKGRGRGKK